MAVIGVKEVDLVDQSGLGSLRLTQLLFQRGDLLIQLRGIHLAVDLFLHHGGEAGLAHQINDDLCHGLVEQLAGQLLLVIALVPTGHAAVLAGIVVEFLVLRAVLLALGALVAVHASAADGALDQSGQDVHMGTLWWIDALIFVRLCSQLDLRRLPDFLGYNGFVDAVHQQIVIAPADLVFVAGAVHLFGFAAAIGDLAAINGVLQNLPDEPGVEQRCGAGMALDFVNAVVLQIP